MSARATTSRRSCASDTRWRTPQVAGTKRRAPLLARRLASAAYDEGADRTRIRSALAEPATGGSDAASRERCARATRRRLALGRSQELIDESAVIAGPLRTAALHARLTEPEARFGCSARPSASDELVVDGQTRVYVADAPVRADDADQDGAWPAAAARARRRDVALEPVLIAHRNSLLCGLITIPSSGGGSLAAAISWSTRSAGTRMTTE